MTSTGLASPARWVFHRTGDFHEQENSDRRNGSGVCIDRQRRLGSPVQRFRAVQQDGATTEQPLEQVRGRALVDLPAHSLKCGEFGDLPAAIAQSLAAAGEFDPKAVEA